MGKSISDQDEWQQQQSGFRNLGGNLFAQAAAGAAATRDAERKVIDTEEDASALADTARRNEATAMRQNQSATLNREGTRAGGGCYRRRWLFVSSGSGLNTANAAAISEARKKARYAALDRNQANNGMVGGSYISAVGPSFSTYS